MSLPILCPRKSFALALALSGILAVALSGPARAESDGDSSLDRRVDVALVDAAPGESFQSFAQMIGLEAQIAGGRKMQMRRMLPPWPGRMQACMR